MADTWRLDWREVIKGTERYWQSARSVDIVETFENMLALDFVVFMRKHDERSGSKYLELARRDPAPGIIEEKPVMRACVRPAASENFRATHLHNLSWVECEGAIYRIIVVDTCERRLVMEAFDLRQWLGR